MQDSPPSHGQPLPRNEIPEAFKSSFCPSSSEVTLMEQCPGQGNGCSLCSLSLQLRERWIPLMEFPCSLIPGRINPHAGFLIRHSTEFCSPAPISINSLPALPLSSCILTFPAPGASQACSRWSNTPRTDGEGPWSQEWVIRLWMGAALGYPQS